ncbi:endonuclease domain-containing protein [Sphingomonas soli]|uniref:endonuclease domain-containing protein n=1 Tax=Sphingomonas soli TaxID=266127 RepID=UPI000A029ECF|nr:endonuclease domain-containing protein [Sphingomonas soli]
MRDPELLRRAREMRSNPTPPEARLWYHLRARRFEATKFRFQTVLGNYIVDFTSRAAMLAIEVDGDTHATQQAYDDRRTAFLESQGFRVLRFTNSDVMTNLDGVLQTIAHSLSACGEREGADASRRKGEGRSPRAYALVAKTPSPGFAGALPTRHHQSTVSNLVYLCSYTANAALTANPSSASSLARPAGVIL